MIRVNETIDNELNCGYGFSGCIIILYVFGFIPHVTRAQLMPPLLIPYMISYTIILPPLYCVYTRVIKICNNTKFKIMFIRWGIIGKEELTVNDLKGILYYWKRRSFEIDHCTDFRCLLSNLCMLLYLFISPYFKDVIDLCLLNIKSS